MTTTDNIATMTTTTTTAQVAVQEVKQDGGHQGAQSILRVAVLGNVDSGKSTLVGVLTKAVLDDGRGSSRSSITTLKHEKELGRTSAIGVQMMAFGEESQIVPTRGTSWVDMAKASSKTISLIDLCGHAKYLKTTVFGLTGMRPHYAMVIVGANMGIPRITKEHLVSDTHSLSFP
jgi:GTPase